MEGLERLPTFQHRYFVSYYVLYYQHDEETLVSFIQRLYSRYKKGPDLNLAPPALYLSYAPECVYCKVEDELSICLKTKTPSCILKKKSKFCI